MGDPGRSQHRRDRDLQLEEHDVRLADPIRDALDILFRQIHVGPRGDDDAVFPFGVDVDQRDAGRQLGDEDATSIQAFPLIVQDGIVSEHIPTHLADQRGITAEPAGRHGLIGPFSAGTHDKVSADQGFPRPGKRSRTDRHVRIAASEYEDLCHTIR